MKTRILKAISIATLLTLIAGACSSPENPVATVDGAKISIEDFEALHADATLLDVNQLAGSTLLLILHEAFTTRALDDLGIEASPDKVEEVYAEYLLPLEARGNLETVLEAKNETEARIRINATLDVLKDEVGTGLVLSESDEFDLDFAYEQYLMDAAEVCVQLMQLTDDSDFDIAVARLTDGESFGDVARDISIDPFVQREEGSGAGGDLGCSAPSALPTELGLASLTAPIDEASGPVLSETGLYLLWIYDRTTTELEDVRSDVLDHAVSRQGPELFRRWAVDVLTSIDVTIDAKYGAWGVLPETEPVPTVVPNYRLNDILAGPFQ